MEERAWCERKTEKSEIEKENVEENWRHFLKPKRDEKKNQISIQIWFQRI